VNISSWSDLPEPVRAHYPWEGHDLALTSGFRLHYLDEGTGETLLMVHGNPTWSFYYRTLVQGLMDDYRCVVPDHIGCGLSDKPQDWPYNLADHVDNLCQLIEHLDLHDITLVVHDWGGAIGFGAATRMPERFKRFVVFNTAVFMGPIPWALKLVHVPVVGSVLVRGLNGFVRGGLIASIADRKRMRNGVGQGYLAPYNTWRTRVANHRMVLDIPVDENHPTWQPLHAIDAALPVFRDHPMLIVWGEQDFVFTNWFRDEWVKRFPDAELHSLPDCSHWIVEDAHERIVPWMRDFLQRNPLADQPARSHTQRT
jgi:haloalkane dehalogenase